MFFLLKTLAKKQIIEYTISMEKRMFDIVVIGAGPAGISAAIYAKRAGRSVVLIEKVSVGGQLNLIDKIENYAGFKSISGTELAFDMAEHAKFLDIPFIYDEVIDIEQTDDAQIVVGRNDRYSAKAVVLALGHISRELGIEGEDRLKGMGVSYCAVCDGRFFKNKNVAVVGSGDSAFSDALYLSSLCKHVYLLTKDHLKMHNYTLNDIEKHENVTLLSSSISKKIEGGTKVEKLAYERNGKEEKLDVEAVFVAIGRRPNTEMFEGKIELDDKGYIVVDENMHTTKKGIFACGDVVKGNMKQISVAVGQGAIAGNEASKYVLQLLAK